MIAVFTVPLTPQGLIFVVVVAVLGFELRAWHLLYRYSTTYATPPGLIFN
jgi:hypothetical protein